MDTFITAHNQDVNKIVNEFDVSMISRQEVEEALLPMRPMHCHDFIDSIREKIDTMSDYEQLETEVYVEDVLSAMLQHPLLGTELEYEE